MKYILTFLTLCFLNIKGFSQGPNPNQKSNEYTIVGQIIEEQTGNPLEFATVSIYNKSNDQIIEGTLSDENGKFEISLVKGQYYLKAEFISFTPVTIDPIVFEDLKIIDVKQIFLQPNSQMLEDIEITAEKSETIFALDKKVFTVGKDLANRGGSAEDILDNVPSVTVDIDGNVSLRGSEGVRILIDGRPSGLTGVNGLKSIPANLIEKIEVITNPSARYEAEGMAGIINIILKKNQAGGFNGSFDLSGGVPLRTGLSANLNYRKGKINWFANYGLNYDENKGGGKQLQDRQINDQSLDLTSRQISFQDREINRSSISNSFRFGMDYFLSEKEQLTGSFLFRRSNNNNDNSVLYTDYIGNSDSFGIDPLWQTQSSESSEIINENDLLRSLSVANLFNNITRTDDETEESTNLEYSLNYRKTFSSSKHSLNASIQFNERTETESSLLQSLFEPFLLGSEDDLIQTSANQEGQKSWLFQADYIHPIGEDHKFETGLRSSFRDITNDYIVEERIDGEFQQLAAFTNNFLYDENIHAAYGTYGNKLGKFSYQFGLRGEYSFINTRLRQENIENERDYFNLFPSGFLNYNFSEQSAIQASYSRRVNRPRFWDLNPFFTFSDNRNFFSGNPNIDPEFTDSYEIGQIQYLDGLSVNTSLFYRKTNASIQRVLIVNLTDITTLRTPINIGTTQDLGLDLSVNFSAIEWLKLDANWNIFLNELSLDESQTQSAIFNYYTTVRNYSGTQSEFDSQFSATLNEFSNVTWNGRLTSKIDFWDSDLQLRLNYRAARQSAQGRREPIATVDIGWSKDLLQEKNLTLTLSARDLFNSRRRNSITLLDEFYQQGDFQWRGRTVTLTASYRINQKKKRGGKSGGNFDGGGDF